MKAKSFSHKVISYGPGGYKCPCCGPAPKLRQKERRLVRRVQNRLLNQIERQEKKTENIDWWMFPEFDQGDAHWNNWYDWLDKTSE